MKGRDELGTLNNVPTVSAYDRPIILSPRLKKPNRKFNFCI